MAVLLAIFIIWELKYRNAMLPLHFFRNMSFTGANVALTLVSFGLMGSLFFLGQFLQSVQGYTPLEAGIRFLPMAAVSFVSAAASARIAQYLGTKFTVALGILIAGFGFYYFSIIAAVDLSYARFVLAMCIVSLGIGLIMSPATNSVMWAIPVSQAGIGSAINNTTRQIGGALGVAVLGTILNSTYIAEIDAVNWPVALPAQAMEAIRNSIQGAHIVAEKVPYPQLAQMIADKSSEAFTLGSEHALTVAAIIMALSVVLTLFILPNRVRPPQE